MLGTMGSGFGVLFRDTLTFGQESWELGTENVRIHTLADLTFCVKELTAMLQSCLHVIAILQLVQMYLDFFNSLNSQTVLFPFT